MKKLGFIVAAVAALAIAAPSVASAEKIVIKRGGHHYHDGARGTKVVIKRGEHHGYRARAEFRGHRDHGWHRGHGSKTVIIKRGHGDR